MLGFYLKLLGFNLALTNFVLLMAFEVGSVHASDFLFLNAIQFLLITLIFIFLDLSSSGIDRDPIRSTLKAAKE